MTNSSWKKVVLKKLARLIQHLARLGERKRLGRFLDGRRHEPMQPAAPITLGNVTQRFVNGAVFTFVHISANGIDDSEARIDRLDIRRDTVPNGAFELIAQIGNFRA